MVFYTAHTVLNIAMINKAENAAIHNLVCGFMMRPCLTVG